MCVDRLVLTVDIAKGNKKQRQHLMAAVATYLEHNGPGDAGVTRAGQGCKSKVTGYKLNFLLFQATPEDQEAVHGPWKVGKDAPTMLVQCAPSREGYAFLRLDVNPAHWKPWQLQDAFKRLGHVIGSQALLDALATASVTRLDIALDMPVPMDGLYWAKPRTEFRKTIAPFAGIGTVYLGKTPNAPGSLRIYDKAREAKLSDPLTRVEFTIGSAGKHVVRPADLPEMKNPFLKVQCFDVLKAISAPGLVPETWRRSFVIHCQAEGLKTILAGIPQDGLRARLNTACLTSRPPSWEPEATWQQWPAALAHALPILFNPPLAAAL